MTSAARSDDAGFAQAGLTAIEGIRVGHASDYEGLTGCTVILCEQGAVAGYDIRGAATGTEEFFLMSPEHLTQKIHAVVLAGGSAFGLEAASGVRRYLEKRGVGFRTPAATVPLVVAAIIYDLSIGSSAARPTREMGEVAAATAHSGPVAEGSVGAGTGATVGKILGITHAMKSGLGTSARRLAGQPGSVWVAALAVVNAFGDVRDPSTGKLLAGARRRPDSFELVDTAKLLASAGPAEVAQPFNTTLVVVATDAQLTKPEATRLAQMATAGMARVLSPPWTQFDGDLVIALSVGTKRADLNRLGVAAADAVAESILRAVQLAHPHGGLPALGG